MASIPEDLKCIVETKDGPICGYIDKPNNRGPYYRFKSIPYAKPPIGRLRFLPPSPIETWKDVKNCTEDAPNPMCPAISKDLQQPITGSEDCLFIEVSTSNLNPKKPMPVMFMIGSHSFAYFLDNSIFDITLFNDYEVVFVRCGFRLGPFGFLSINDYTAPGNCGLKDLIMALKWVQRNISVFGGDPNSVTIAGNSSGGAIAHFMMLSPMATGLFHKAIIKSASALNNWALTKNPSQLVVKLGKHLGITKNSKAEIVEELRSIPAVDIMIAFKKMTLETHKGTNNDVVDAVFKPCIELDLEGQPAFITKSPVLIMNSGNFNRVPLIIGSNNIEDATLLYINKENASFDKINENVCLLVPRSLAGEDKLLKSIGDRLLKFYLGGEGRLREETRIQYLQLISDYYFSYYVNKTIRIHTQVAPECPIFYFIMNWFGEWAIPKDVNFLGTLEDSLDAYTALRIKMPNFNQDSRDFVTTRNRVIKMWTNFAKTGTPTPDSDDPLLQITWDPVENKDKLNYLNISSELTKGRNPFYERMNFWDQLHQDHKFLRALVYFSDIGVSW